MRTNVFCLETR